MSTERRTTIIIQKKNRKSSLKGDDAFDQKYKSAVKAYHNYMEGLNHILKTKEAKMCKILRNRSVPLWFQELTDEQCQVCDQLLDAIADDTVERTYHRTEALIRKLGVYPVCPKRILRTALILCNENDISLLWILLELHYIRRPGKEAAARVKEYTINERILFSAIAHLDMMTTLRGLEKVLPPKKPIVTKVATEKEENATEKQTQSSKPSSGKSPYLRPQSVFHTGFSVPVEVQPHRDEFLGRYEKYRDTEYVIRSEATRWFTNYGGSRRNMFSCKYYISSEDQQDSLSTCSDHSTTSASAVVRTLLDDNIRNMIANIECCQLLCPKHHQLDERDDNILRMLNRNTAVQDVLMRTVRAQCAQWTKQELAEDGKRQVESLLKRLIDEAVTMAILEPAKECPECQERFDMQKKLLKGQKCSCAKLEDSETPVSESVDQLKCRYFRLCDKSVPFEFDYDRIFETEKQKEQICPIKCAIQRALGVEQAESSVDVDEAIEKFARMTWEEEMKHWKEQMAGKSVRQESKYVLIDPLELDYIDTKNVSELQKLLKRALRRLAEHPLYLLATFPNVDQLPILKAWVRKRYGVPVSAQERTIALMESKHFWDYLIPRATGLRWPTRKDRRSRRADEEAGLELQVNWDYKTQLESMVGSMMYKFYRKYKTLQIQEGRLWWTSMVPYHAGPDRFRRTFLAYFPNCEPERLPLVRPWRPSGYRAMPRVKGSNSRNRF
uniref:DUF4771 domain-containing protein n=1 Tax=Anopheles farauti TaxID=69004 RepID=A0A182R033_9DIPT